MKSDTLEDTPSKKKMKQARLPFKIVSESSTAPISNSTSRKRKLSSDIHKESKIGRLSKENGIGAKISDDVVVIIDDDSRETTASDKATSGVLSAAVSPKLSTPKKNTRSSNKSDNSDKLSVKKLTPKNNKSSVEKNNDKDCVNKLTPRSTRNSCVTENNDKNAINILTPRRVKNSSDLEVNCDIKSTPRSTRQSENSMSDNNEKNIDSILTPKNIKQSVSQKVDKEPTTPKNIKQSVSQKVDKEPTTPKNIKQSVSQKVDKEPTTPKNTGNSSISENSDSANKLTPKQLQKKLEAAKRKEDREKEKEERDKKKQEEKDERARAKQEKEDQKKKERDEKEEIKKKEKEEKEKQKELEKKLKEEKEEQKRKEREEKEEQKRKDREEKEDQRRKEKEAKEEEKRKKQEILELEKQEQELKKKKAAEVFANFFVLKQKVDKEISAGPISKSSVLSSFAIKADMRLAPTVRGQFTDEQRNNLDEFLENQSVKELSYLKCLRNGTLKPGCDGKTWPNDKDEDVIIIEDELQAIEGVEEVLSSESIVREKLRPKLLSFKENRRPPYWGTWRKKSNFIKPRNPFGRDEKLLDYEVDSDEDWEDEEGESIDGSRCSDDDNGELDEYEVDNEVFVPHGYLSDEEATMDGDDMMSLSPETQKARLKHLEDEFESEMKKPTEKLKPRLFGPLWVTENGGQPENCVDPLWNYLQKYSMIMDDSKTFSLLQPSQESEVTEKKKKKQKKNQAEGENENPKNENKSSKVKPEKKNKSKVKETKKTQKNQVDLKIKQPGINSFLKKIITP